MFGTLGAKIALLRAGVAYGKSPTAENEELLMQAVEASSGKPRPQWIEADSLAFENAKAQRPVF